MTEKILDRVDGTLTTVGATTSAIVAYTMTTPLSIGQFYTRVVGFNTATVGTNDRGLSATVKATFARGVSAGAPGLIGTIIVDDPETDAAFALANLTYGVTGNTVKLNITGVATYTIQWFAMMRPMIWTP